MTNTTILLTFCVLCFFFTANLNLKQIITFNPYSHGILNIIISYDFSIKQSANLMFFFKQNLTLMYLKPLLLWMAWNMIYNQYKASRG